MTPGLVRQVHGSLCKQLTRTDINTLRRLIKHEYGAAAQQPPCNNDFLLVAAAENSEFRFSGAFERSQVETLE